MTLLHGTTVEFNGHGLFITGASGAGKSDLAIRLIDRGAVLVSDDYTEVKSTRNTLTATVPKNIKGKIEAYGIGIIDAKNKDQTTINLVINLVDTDKLERMPKDDTVTIEGISLPQIYLCAKHASAVAKLCLYLKSLA